MEMEVEVGWGGRGGGDSIDPSEAWAQCSYQLYFSNSFGVGGVG